MTKREEPNEISKFTNDQNESDDNEPNLIRINQVGSFASKIFCGAHDCQLAAKDVTSKYTQVVQEIHSASKSKM